MFARTWFDSLKSRFSRPSSGTAAERRLRRRLRLESLEARDLLAFDLAVDYPVGASPQAIVTADFNNDGRLDVATANYFNSNGGNDVSVLLGNPDGTFQSPRTSPMAGGQSSSLAVGDFNGDGRLDLVASNLYAYDVRVLLGNGDGTFQAAASFDVGSSTESSTGSVAVGDFNGDGKSDLAVTSNGLYAYANVLLGDGAGSFGAPIATWLGFYTVSSAAVADFDGDGKLDFATIDQGWSIGGEYGKLTVLRGAGNGTFGNPDSFDFGKAPRSLTAGDVNADGKIDLVAVSSNLNGSVGVLVGDGLGSFGAVQNYAAGLSPLDVALADFNGDGTTDLIATNPSAGPGALSVLLGSGAGAFNPPLTIVNGASPFYIAVGDFNGDGRPDAVSANPNSNNVSVLLNDGNWPSLEQPSISINDVNVVEGNTGTVSANFKVNLSTAYGETVSVHYVTANGSATAGSDYQAASGDLIFVPGVTSQTVSVLVNGDRLGEYTGVYSESFFVHLSDATNAFIARATGLGTILDDEPSMYIEGYQAAEGNSGVTLFPFVVTLSAAYDVPVTVDYATADLTPDDYEWYYALSATAGVDYATTFGTLTIPAGEMSGTITVPVFGDRIGEDYEWAEMFSVKLSNPNYALLQTFNDRAFGAILDDEPYVSINSGMSSLEGNSGTTPVTFIVSLWAAYDADVTVSYATADGTATAGSDYVAASGEVTIPAGQTSQTLTVLVNGDLLREGNESFLVNLIDASGLLFWDSSAVAIIIDDDAPPTISIGDASVVEGNSGTQLMSFVVSLSNSSGAGVWVNYNTANGTATTSNNDYVAKSGTIYFAPGETSQTIQIAIKGDTKKEQDERFYVNLSGASGAAIGDSQGVGTLLNDDGGGKGSKGSSKTLTASAVDAAIVELMSDPIKKHGR